MTTFTHLECSRCGAKYEPAPGRSACDCGGPLVARYDLEAARAGWSRDWLKSGPWNMWGYTPVLPVRKPASIVSLGEGLTPLLRATRLGAANLWIKDEGRNPAGVFEARGFSCAVSMAVELGVRELALPAAGGAAAAFAAYAAAAGIPARIFLPRTAPQAEYVECRAYGARVTLVDALDVPALEEPYRIEGEKTLGYEIAEQLSWSLPGVIVCPRGAGVAGMWKAFDEMEQIGWVSGARPKMFAVGGCPPEAAAIVRASGGAVVGIGGSADAAAGLDLAAAEGILAAPETAAALVAVRALLDPADRIVLCNMASGLRSPEAYARKFPRAGGEPDKLGGLITPR
jgi:threonine synthase